MDSRQRAIDATAALLWRQGLRATGINQIVEESKSPRGSIYFHFPGGKEELAAAALRSAGAVMTANIRGALAHRDVRTAVKRFVLSYAKEMRESDFQHGCPIATVALAATTLFLQSQYSSLESEIRKTGTYDSLISTRGFNLQDLVFNDNSRLVHFEAAQGFEGTATAFVDASSQKVRLFHKNFAKELTAYHVVALDERGEEIGVLTRFNADKKIDFAGDFGVDLKTTKRLAIKEITPEHPEGRIVLTSAALLG
ncbi:MAG: TetR/AcrR family transcriptional regulator [Phycisphaerales bacterium]|nr:TetR/AcrR family transcriptional regulator [Phycisphaerales bacterium]